MVVHKRSVVCECAFTNDDEAPRTREPAPILNHAFAELRLSPPHRQYAPDTSVAPDVDVARNSTLPPEGTGMDFA